MSPPALKGQEGTCEFRGVAGAKGCEMRSPGRYREGEAEIIYGQSEVIGWAPGESRAMYLFWQPAASVLAGEPNYCSEAPAACDPELSCCS